MKQKGLGDTIEAITTFTGIKKLMPEGCGCDRRKKKLNKLIPYGARKQQKRRFTEK